MEGKEKKLEKKRRRNREEGELEVRLTPMCC